MWIRGFLFFIRTFLSIVKGLALKSIGAKEIFCHYYYHLLLLFNEDSPVTSHKNLQRHLSLLRRGCYRLQPLMSTALLSE